MSAPRSLDLTEERNPLLERVRFNVAVGTTRPSSSTTIWRGGDRRRRPGARHAVRDGAVGPARRARRRRVTLNERRYEVERGVITSSTSGASIPSFDLVLNTSARQLRHHACRHRHARRNRDDADVRPDAAGAGHHGAAGHRAHAGRDARRGIRSRPRAGAVVPDRPRRLDAGTRSRARHRAQRGAHRAEPDRERGRSGRAAHVGQEI